MPDQLPTKPSRRARRAPVGRLSNHRRLRHLLVGVSGGIPLGVGIAWFAGSAGTVLVWAGAVSLFVTSWALSRRARPGSSAEARSGAFTVCVGGAEAADGSVVERRDGLAAGHGETGSLAEPESRPATTDVAAAGNPDPLTGLIPRGTFVGLIETVSLESPVPSVAVLALDLDGFAALNETLGPDFGDEILRHVAAALRRCVRPWDTVARIGGDEFAVLVAGDDAERSVNRLHERLRRALGAVVISTGQEVRLGVSAGYAVADGHDPAGDVLRNAELALARARTAHRIDVLRYEAPMRAALLSRVQAEQELRAALAGHQLELVYQPVVSLEDGQTVGAEALVRWRHPERGLVVASEFVPLAEQMRIVHELGVWALRQACRDLRQIKDLVRDLGSFEMSINVSGHQIGAELVTDVAAAAADAGVSPGELVLEVTESVLALRQEEATDVLGRLRALGCRVALDDFGTGYSSLSYLARFPVDIIKIDRSFVGGVQSDPQQLALTRTIVALGQALHLRIIAEGVETDEQAALLRGLGCTWAQGFLLARPMPLEGLLEHLRSSAELIELTEIPGSRRSGSQRGRRTPGAGWSGVPGRKPGLENSI